MRATLNTKQFANSLKLLAGIYDRHSRSAILTAVLIESLPKERAIRLTAVDHQDYYYYTAHLRLTLPVVGDDPLEDWRIAVSLPDLRQILTVVPKISQQVTLAEQGDKIVLDWGYGNSLLSYFLEDIAEFPAFPTIPGTDPAWTNAGWRDLDQATFISALAAVIPALSTDEARQLLLCVHVNGNYLQATDGFRLHRFSIPNSLPPDGLIPGKLAKLLVKLNNNATLVRLFAGYTRLPGETVEDRLFVYTDDAGVEATATLKLGSYPNIEQVIPVDREGDIILTIQKDQVAEWVDSLAIISKVLGRNEPILRLTIDKKDERLIEVALNENLFTSKLPISGLTFPVNGKDNSGVMKVYYNPAYLKDLFASSGKQDITLRLKRETLPCKLTAETYFALMMPMFGNY